MPIKSSLPPIAKSLGFATLLLFIGSSLTVAALLRWPDIFFTLSQTVSWRLKWPSPGQTLLESTMTRIQLRGDLLVKAGDVLMFGDSHLQAIPGPRLGRAVNYALGGETMERLALRVVAYSSVQTASYVVVMSGRNDLAAGIHPQIIEASLIRVLGAIPLETPISVVAIPPGRDSSDGVQRRRETNRRFESACMLRKGCHFANLELLAEPDGTLNAKFDAGDGIHLNQSGYVGILTELQASVRPQ